MGMQVMPAIMRTPAKILIHVATSMWRPHLTRTRSATAGGSERGLQWRRFHKVKRGIGAASGWLHRLVRLFVIHAFNRRGCGFDGDWIQCAGDVVDLRWNCNRKIFASCTWG